MRRRRFGRRKFGKRKRFGGRKSGKRKRIRRAMNTNRQCFHTAMTFAVEVTESAGATNQLDFFLNYPSYYNNNAGTTGALPIIPPSFTRAVAFYDGYRVNGVKFSFSPYQNMQSFKDVQPLTTYIKPNVYTTVDVDDSSSLTTTKAIGNPSFRMMSMFRSWRRYVSCKGMYGSGSMWFNTANLNPAGTVGTQASILPINSFACFKVLFDVNAGAGTSQPLGLMLIKYYITFRSIATQQT